jgi:hypothetical protein
MRTWWKILIGAAATAVLIVAGVAGDRLLSRPDRIRLDAEMIRLRRLQDAILRFTLDREALPQALAELVPAYTSAEMLRFRPSRWSQTEQPIRWDPASGTLAWSVPFRIYGLLPRNRPFQIAVPKRPVTRDPLSGVNVFRQVSTPTLLEPEDIIVEPELFQSLTYGWQIEESESASGNTYLHIKEGIGDIIDHIGAPYVEFDPKKRSGDFYNVAGSRARIEAQCSFEAPADGEYFLMARLMPGRSVCSNVIRLQVDDQPEFIVGFNKTEPFVWAWQPPGWGTPPSITLSKGAHWLKFHTYQDGAKVDQVVLSRKKPELAGVGVVTGGYPQKPTAPGRGVPLNLSLSIDTLTVTDAKDPTVWAYVRKAEQPARQAQLQVSLDLPGGRVRVREYPITLPADAPLLKFPCEVALPRPLDRKEYLLRCRLVDGDKRSQERTTVLYHGYDWSILGPLPFIKVEERCEPEAAATLAARYRFGDREYAWQKYNEEFTDQFGIMDFGRMFCGRSFDAMTNAAVYAYTEVEVARGGDYLLKAQGDDHLVVWINGQKVAAIVRTHETAIRSAAHFPVTLKAGRNRLLFRLNQVSGQWQAGIRLRTADDQVAEIFGVPYAQQGLLAAP